MLFKEITISLLVLACILPLAIAASNQNDFAHENPEEAPDSHEQSSDNANAKPLPQEQATDVQQLLNDAEKLIKDGKVSDAAKKCSDATNISNLMHIGGFAKTFADIYARIQDRPNAKKYYEIAYLEEPDKEKKKVLKRCCDRYRVVSNVAT